MKNKINDLKYEIQKQVIGHHDMIDALLIALISSGHVLLEGLPGLAKTTAVNAIAQTLRLNFHRIQFTPDLLPSDILGAEIYNVKSGEFSIKHGPIFTHILLADEINRAPAKVQSALLEAMQEKQVTLGEKSFPLESPFFVLATQNPMEQNGIYPLPEAQLDRFMFKLIVEYNTPQEEFEIAKKVANNTFETIQACLNVEELQEIKDEVMQVHIDDKLIEYIVALITTSRSHPLLSFGASPRGSIDLLKAVKARAYLRGNSFVSPIDIVLSIKDVLRHRIVPNYEALSQNISADTIIQEILESVDIP